MVPAVRSVHPSHWVRRLQVRCFSVHLQARLRSRLHPSICRRPRPHCLEWSASSAPHLSAALKVCHDGPWGPLPLPQHFCHPDVLWYGSFSAPVCSWAPLAR
jgi:hypothetical protein